MPKYLGAAEDISIETDEDGFFLYVELPDGPVTINVQAVAPSLYRDVRSYIGRWLDEGLDARRHVTDDNSLHSVHADIWDGRQR